MHSGEPLVQWLSNTIHTKIVTKVGVKMQDLPKRLIVFATGSRSGTIVFDSKGNNRDISVPFAVRCSASLPPKFIPAQHDGQDIYDGGMLHNFPVQEFKKLVPNEPFIAIYLGRDTPPKYQRGSWFHDIGSIFLDRDEKITVEEHIKETIVIDPGPIKTAQIDLSDQEKEFLILQGRVAALRFLSNGEFVKNIDEGYLQEVEVRAKTARENLYSNKE